MEPKFGDDKRKSKIENLENKLYSRNSDIKSRERTDLNKKNSNIRENWGDNLGSADNNNESILNVPPIDFMEKPKKNGPFGLILLIALLFFIGAIGYAGYAFYSGNQTVSGDDVEVNIVGPVSVGGGEKLSLDVIIQNNNPVPLELVDVVVEYPEGTKNAEDLITDLRRTREGIGDIASGSVIRKNIEAALFGEEGNNKQIIVEIEYRIPGSNAVFDKKKIFEIALNASPVRVTTGGVKKASSGQSVEIEFNVSSNSNQELKNLMVIADYPFGFNFEKSDIKPTFGKEIWLFDTLRPNEEKTIKITGQITGQNEEERVFRFNAGLQNEQDGLEEELGIIFTTVTHNLVVEKPFIDLALSLNNSEDSTVIVKSNDTLSGNIVFSNNTNDLLRDVEIEVKIDGPIFDEPTIKVQNGFYRSSDNTIIFSKEYLPDLEQIDPRKNIKFAFSFKIIDLKKTNLTIKEPQVKLSASVKAQRISNEESEERINETEVKYARAITDTSVGAFTLYNLGPFSNFGPLPPKVDNETSYTIVWSVSNNSNDLENTKMTATLPSYVSWKNKFSPTNEKVTYDPGSRQIIWDIGTVRSGTGYISAARDLSFQLSILPSLSQLGEAPDLLRNTIFTARDTFAGSNIESLINNPDTTLSDETAIDRHQFIVE